MPLNGTPFVLDVESLSLLEPVAVALHDNGMSMTKTVLFEATVVNLVAPVLPAQSS
jgi:hypothetical protein